MSSFPRLPDEAQAISVRLNDDSIELTLADGRRVATPLAFYPTLLAASPTQRARFAYLGWGTGLEWPELDLQLSVDGIIAGRHEHVPPPGWRKRTNAQLRRLGLADKPAVRKLRRSA